MRLSAPLDGNRSLAVLMTESRDQRHRVFAGGLGRGSGTSISAVSNGMTADATTGDVSTSSASGEQMIPGVEDSPPPLLGLPSTTCLRP
jgi:hypothetical protein